MNLFELLMYMALSTILMAAFFQFMFTWSAVQRSQQEQIEISHEALILGI